MVTVQGIIYFTEVLRLLMNILGKIATYISSLLFFYISFCIKFFWKHRNLPRNIGAENYFWMAHVFFDPSDMWPQGNNGIAQVFI